MSIIVMYDTGISLMSLPGSAISFYAGTIATTYSFKPGGYLKSDSHMA